MFQLGQRLLNPPLLGYQPPPGEPSSGDINALPNRADTNSLPPFIGRKEHGCALRRHNDTSFLHNRSTHHPKSKDASWSHNASSPRMNSSVVLLTNTKSSGGSAPRATLRTLPSRRGGSPPTSSVGHRAGSFPSRAVLQ